MSAEVDVRGLSCPQPVIETKKAIKRDQFPIVVWADTVTSRQNVSRAAEKEGLSVSIEEVGGEFKLTLSQ